MKRKVILTIILSAVSVVLLAQTIFSVEPDKILICGHRGGFYSQFPENSLAAFEFTSSRDKSSRVIVEFDIRKSKQGTLFLMHDETVDRTTNGTGKIADLSDVYLSSLFLKNEKGELTQEKIPTYDELLDYTEKTKNILLMLDVKVDAWEEAIKRLERRRLQSRSIILTFREEDTKKVYSLSQAIAISCLSTDEAKWNAIEALDISKRNLVAYVDSSTPETLLSRIRNAEVPLMTDVCEHTTNQGNLHPESFYQKLVKSKNLSILITDFPSEVSMVSFD